MTYLVLAAVGVSGIICWRTPSIGWVVAFAWLVLLPAGVAMELWRTR